MTANIDLKLYWFLRKELNETYTVEELKNKMREYDIKGTSGNKSELEDKIIQFLEDKLRDSYGLQRNWTIPILKNKLQEHKLKVGGNKADLEIRLLNNILKLDESSEESQSKQKKQSIPKKIKEAVWNIYIGVDKRKGPCFTCGIELDITSFHAGHVQAEVNGGQLDEGNLRPICQSCNSSMGTMNLFKFKEKMDAVKNNASSSMLQQKSTEIIPDIFEIFKLEPISVNIPKSVIIPKPVELSINTPQPVKISEPVKPVELYIPQSVKIPETVIIPEIQQAELNKSPIIPKPVEEKPKEIIIPEIQQIELNRSHIVSEPSPKIEQDNDQKPIKQFLLSSLKSIISNVITPSAETKEWQTVASPSSTKESDRIVLINPIDVQTSIEVNEIIIYSAPSEYLHIRQIEIYDIHNNNIAPLSKVSQTSQYGKIFPVNKIIDYRLDTFNHTNNDNASISIKLNKTSIITKIIIYNRIDCCTERLRGAKMILYLNGSVVDEFILSDALFQIFDWNKK